MKAYKLSNPKLFDIVIGELQDHLEAKLPWLDHIFGRAQILTRLEDRGRAYKYPAVHLKKGEYTNVLPDQVKGNTVFVLVRDPMTINNAPGQILDISSKIAIIFWYRLDDIFKGTTERDNEAVKEQILAVLSSQLHLKTGRLTMTSVLEEAANIFKEFSIRELDSQYLMQPYAGLRVECEIKIRNICYKPVVPEPKIAYLVDDDLNYLADEDGNLITE